MVEGRFLQSASPPLRGADVRELQLLVQTYDPQKGTPGFVDGVFGGRTLLALKKFQQSKGLAQTGSVHSTMVRSMSTGIVESIKAVQPRDVMPTGLLARFASLPRWAVYSGAGVVALGALWALGRED